MSNSLNSLIIKSENLDGSLKILDFRSTSAYRESLIESYCGDPCSWKEQMEKTISWKVRNEIGKMKLDNSSRNFPNSHFFQLLFQSTYIPFCVKCATLCILLFLSVFCHDDPWLLKFLLWEIGVWLNRNVN